MRFRVILLTAVLVLAAFGQARAQLSLEARTSVPSAYVWRGLTVVNRPVVQPEVTLSAGPAAIDLWANIEPFRYRGSDDLSVLAGRRAPGFTELDPSVEVSHEVGKLGLAAGAIAYFYTHAAGYETEPNTVELYGRVEVPGAFPLDVEGYYDVHSVRGLYVEAGVERPLPGWSALALGARAGASLGEAAGPETVYYDRDGITHIQVSASWPFVAGPLRLTPECDVAFAVDGATRITSPTRTHRAKIWLGASVAWPGRGE